MNTESNFVILLAEDEASDAHLVKVALQENRILADLQHVIDGQEALDFVRRHGSRFAAAPRPDLILLDLNMPRMDGREFLHALKQDQALCDIPVVILTTSQAQRDIQSCYSLGASGFITKPIDIGQFINVINGLSDYWIKLVHLPHHHQQQPS